MDRGAGERHSAEGVTMADTGAVKLEGQSPFLLPEAKSAQADLFERSVVVTLYSEVEGQGPALVSIAVQMLPDVALALATQLRTRRYFGRSCPPVDIGRPAFLSLTPGSPRAARPGRLASINNVQCASGGRPRKSPDQRTGQGLSVQRWCYGGSALPKFPPVSLAPIGAVVGPLGRECGRAVAQPAEGASDLDAYDGHEIAALTRQVPGRPF
jgi:hypothetical protein